MNRLDPSGRVCYFHFRSVVLLEVSFLQRHDEGQDLRFVCLIKGSNDLYIKFLVIRRPQFCNLTSSGRHNYLGYSELIN